MAKKKELPKAMMGRTIVKHVVRPIITTGKIGANATVRGGKAFVKSAKHTSVKDALKGADIKAGVKGFVRGVKSETKKLKQPKISIAEPDLGPTKKSTSDWIKSGTKSKTSTNNVADSKPKTSTNNVANSKPKKKLTTKQKVSIGVATGAAVAGGIKYANRKRRTLND